MFRIKKSSFNTPSNGVTHIIVGLGNPGSQYEYTRHNIGFLAIDQIAKEYNTKIDRLQFKALYSKISINGIQTLLVKPQTYMNNSGESVREFMDYYKIPPENVVIIFDDISLDVGSMRVKRKGSAGGHNGLKSIFYLTKSDNFPRIKIGVGAKPHPDYDLADWVLSRFNKDELKVYQNLFDNIIKASTLIISGQTDLAMNQYN